MGAALVMVDLARSEAAPGGFELILTLAYQYDNWFIIIIID